MARVVLGVAGGIAAYKSCELLRRLIGDGHEVRVVPTRAALEFVGAATWAALSGQPVAHAVWSDVHEVPHVRLGQEADLVLVAPATADVLARAAHGLADDLLGNVLLTARCPVVLAPAMHTEMWQHPATVANVATLRSRGVMVIDPAHGRLTGADSGPGRLPEAAELAAVAESVLAGGVPPRDLVGRRVLVSAGGTREMLDPVRFLGNRSSGKQGYAIAAAARDRGAQVTLVAANCALPDPAGVEVVPVLDAAALQAAINARAGQVDVVVMAAAVADYRPAVYSDVKVKKVGGGLPVVELVENPDVLAGLAASRRGPAPLLVGFAAETGDSDADPLTHAWRKFAAKGCDLMVVNVVGDGVAFEVDTNAARILAVDGRQWDVPHGSKRRLAEAVWDAVGAVGGGD
ncbi:MAG: phosphopantothenoylcysteine decarboxylase / phosphopantothenate---cysteine ligase [Actinomycetota bacterium]|nr:phosphopantothenoylcysteine decarboxylase / phosphopantothenate---cysteine ligase [Actinomycetota bacterium]